MFYNKYKWSITFKNYESLCWTLKTFIIIVHQLYLNKKTNYKKMNDCVFRKESLNISAKMTRRKMAPPHHFYCTLP